MWNLSVFLWFVVLLYVTLLVGWGGGVESGEGESSGSVSFVEW